MRGFWVVHFQMPVRTFPQGEGPDDSRRKRIAVKMQNSVTNQDGRLRYGVSLFRQRKR